jgi:hypothetical protein
LRAAMRRHQVRGVLVVVATVLACSSCTTWAAVKRSLREPEVRPPRVSGRELRRMLFDRVSGCVKESVTSVVAVSASFQPEGHAWTASVDGSYDLTRSEIECISKNLARSVEDAPVDHRGDASVAWAVASVDRSQPPLDACRKPGDELGDFVVLIRHIAGFPPIVTLDDDIAPDARACIAPILARDYGGFVVGTRLTHRVRIKAPRRAGPLPQPYDSSSVKRELDAVSTSGCEGPMKKAAPAQPLRLVFESSGKVAAIALQRPVATKPEACIVQRHAMLRVAPFRGPPRVELRHVPSYVAAPWDDLD